MSYTIIRCWQPWPNEPWKMECEAKGVYPTREAAMKVIRKKFTDEVTRDLKRSADDWKSGMTEAMVRGMIINDWMIEKSRSSMSWYQYGEPYPVRYKVVKIPTERKKK